MIHMSVRRRSICNSASASKRCVPQYVSTYQVDNAEEVSPTQENEPCATKDVIPPEEHGRTTVGEAAVVAVL